MDPYGFGDADPLGLAGAPLVGTSLPALWGEHAGHVEDLDAGVDVGGADHGGLAQGQPGLHGA
jgi:hypothetical protein